LRDLNALAKTLPATTVMAECYDFSMGSAFRAIGQSPTRNALVSEIRRDQLYGTDPLLLATTIISSVLAQL
jgi:hypothetical protein